MAQFVPAIAVPAYFKANGLYMKEAVNSTTGVTFVSLSDNLGSKIMLSRKLFEDAEGNEIAAQPQSIAEMKAFLKENANSLVISGEPLENGYKVIYAEQREDCSDIF